MIVDANVLSSAILGRSLPLLLEIQGRGIELLMPLHQFSEAKNVAARNAGWSEDRFERFASGVIAVLPVNDYVRGERFARARLGSRGQPDWPVLAAAIELGHAIWTNDRDFFGVGVAVWTTDNIKFAEKAS